MRTSADLGGTVHVSIDVSKHSLDVCILPSGGSFAVSNDQVGIESLLNRIPQPHVELVILEACGRCERPVAAAFAAAGIVLAAVNLPQARDFAKATGRLAKTDRIDAQILARFAAAVEPRPSILPDEKAQALQAILTRRRQLLEMVVAENNRLGMASTSVAKRIRAHIKWLKKAPFRTDRELDEPVEASTVWKENETLLRSAS